jgi:hypothetical protein
MMQVYVCPVWSGASCVHWAAFLPHRISGGAGSTASAVYIRLAAALPAYMVSQHYPFAAPRRGACFGQGLKIILKLLHDSVVSMNELCWTAVALFHLHLCPSLSFTQITEEVLQDS